MDELLTPRRAVPILLRHLGAYADLAARDIASGRLYLRARVSSLLALAASVGFCVMTIYVAVIAGFWDTPYRLTCVYSLAVLSAVTTAAAGAYAWRVRSRQPCFLESVRCEWQNDCAAIQRIISGTACEPPDKVDGESVLHT